LVVPQKGAQCTNRQGKVKGDSQKESEGMNTNTAVALINIGLFTLVGFAVYCTKSAWPMLGLIFIVGATENIKRSED